MSNEKVSYEIAYSLMNSCSKGSTSLIKVTPCKKALGSILKILNYDNEQLITRLLDDKSRISEIEYKEIKKYLVFAFKREFGVKSDMMLVGKSKSKIGLDSILVSLVKLVECTRNNCASQKNVQNIKCASTKCSEMLIVCLELICDIYTKIPCKPEYKTTCEPGMKRFDIETKLLISKIRSRKLLVEDLANIEMKLRMLWSMIELM